VDEAILGVYLSQRTRGGSRERCRRFLRVVKTETCSDQITLTLNYLKIMEQGGGNPGVRSMEQMIARHTQRLLGGRESP
jgi:hypothetical protein